MDTFRISPKIPEQLKENEEPIFYIEVQRYIPRVVGGHYTWSRIYSGSLSSCRKILNEMKIANVGQEEIGWKRR